MKRDVQLIWDRPPFNLLIVCALLESEWEMTRVIVELFRQELWEYCPLGLWRVPTMPRRMIIQCHGFLCSWGNRQVWQLHWGAAAGWIRNTSSTQSLWMHAYQRKCSSWWRSCQVHCECRFHSEHCAEGALLFTTVMQCLSPCCRLRCFEILV